MKLNVKTAQRTIHIALILSAISPIFEKIDVLFYSFFFLFIILFITVLVNVIKVYRENPENFLKLLFTSPRENLYFILICAVGIVVGYLMGNSNHIITWSVLLGVTLLIMLIPTKKKAEQMCKRVFEVQNHSCICSVSPF